MKSFKILVTVLSLLAASSAFAKTYPNKEIQKDEAASMEAAQAYAQSVGKEVPEIQDYTYSTKYSVAKLIYTSPSIEYCGVIPKIMVFEDKNSDLRSIRYRALGECRNQR
ncbi:DUF2790 domain-containing protein [Pseudomonas sp. Marseille-Q0931]|uniref:DUF2790 domain-containing protein n=1 Tax=Pseudomonas sp. Marseille-Q0931 TaxID=2697507 RepID=UPI0023B999AD|nr:DUF2790 domain-containing protein [Pseudomonas sp. Marseille-Q0931]